MHLLELLSMILIAFTEFENADDFAAYFGGEMVVKYKMHPISAKLKTFFK